jgi:acetyl esterase/lipase
MQQFDFSLPSYEFHKKNKLVSFTGCSLVKLVLWYFGETDVSNELEKSVSSNEHVLLIQDIEKRKIYADYLDVDLIPEIYKSGKSYYNNFNKFKKSELIEKKLDNQSIFKKNEHLGNLVKNLFNEDVSPGLANDELLKLLPKAYVIVWELDELNDENMIYAERLRRNGVDVKIAFYEEGYNGLIESVNEHTMNRIALKMVDDLVDYIKENI